MEISKLLAKTVFSPLRSFVKSASWTTVTKSDRKKKVGAVMKLLRLFR